MAKKRGRKAVKTAPRRANAAKGKAKESRQKKPAEKKHNAIPSFFSRIFNKAPKKPQDERRKHEEEDLRHIEKEVGALREGAAEKAAPEQIPTWFYLTSVFASFLFTLYISLFATIHFESIEYMNTTIVFLFITMVAYFLISVTYFISEKKTLHWIPAFLFFAGVSTIMVYAFKAVDTSNLVKFSIIYTIIVTGISTYVLAVKRKSV